MLNRKVGAFETAYYLFSLCSLPQQCLNFFLLPQGQGWFLGNILVE